MPLPRMTLTDEQQKWQRATRRDLEAMGVVFDHRGAWAGKTMIFLDPRKMQVQVEIPQRPGMIPQFVAVTPAEVLQMIHES